MSKAFLTALLLGILTINCRFFEPVTVTTIPFQPVIYQSELNDPASRIFKPAALHRIDVDVNADLSPGANYDPFDSDRSDGVDYTYEASDGISPVKFIFNNGEVVISGIGMRLRGGWSFDNALKKKFKIIFPEDNLFYGLKRINLNSNFSDNSFVREKLVYDFFNTVGVPSGRANYTRLYINNQYMGLYLIVEQVKKRFLETRFGNPVGNLYKNNYHDFGFDGTNGANYISSVNNFDRSLEILVGETTSDYQDIADFLTKLNLTPDDQFETMIQQYFLVYEFLSALAVNTLVGLMDDYWYYAHNNMLYNFFGKFMWIPWDLDSSFGNTLWTGYSSEVADIYAFSERESGDLNRPLIDRILAVPSFKSYYRKCIKHHIEVYFNETCLYPKIDNIAAIIKPAALQDSYYQPLSEGQFNSALSVGDGYNSGIKDYIRNRKAYVWPYVWNAY